MFGHQAESKASFTSSVTIMAIFPSLNASSRYSVTTMCGFYCAILWCKPVFVAVPQFISIYMVHHPVCVCIYVRMCVCMCVYVCMYLFMCVCM